VHWFVVGIEIALGFVFGLALLWVIAKVIFDKLS
jgi:hypothetical protein